jgi:ATP-binding cassette, subfamily B, bacterial PglK
MLDSLRVTFGFLTRRELRVWRTYTALRAGLSIFDLLGVMAIGFVATSIALFLTNGSDPNRVVSFAGLEIPAVNIGTLPIYGAIILVLFLSKSVLALVLAKKSSMFLATVDARAAKEISRSLYGSGISQAQTKSREESTYAIQVGSTTAFSGVLNSLATVVAETTLFVLITIGFFLVNPWVTFATLGYFAVVALVVNRVVGLRVARHGKKLVKKSISANTNISDLISVFREVTTSGRKDEFFKRIHDAKLESARSTAIQFVLGSAPRYIIEAALLIGLTALVVQQALFHGIVESATTLSVFLAGGFRLTGALLPLQTAYLVIKGNLARAKTALEILVEHSTMDNSPADASTSLIDQEDKFGPVSVNVSTASFKHPGNPVPSVDDVSLEIHAGSKVAIIGDSGAGKSTLADLICGILNPDSGTVELSLADMKLQANRVRGIVGYVPQRPALVSGSIAENVALGLSPDEIDKPRVIDCLKQACLWDLVSSLPNGLSTDIGNLRDSLSGGEVQRLGLARALYTKPKLLVMDEATSSLDATSEHEVGKALSALKGKVTMIVIAHRLNTVQNSDKVFLMDSAKLVDSGNFQELVSRNPNLEKTVNLLQID